MTYFTNCTTLDALKAAYKELVWKHHPDRGGDTATMQAINAEYQERFEALKSGAADAQTAEMPEDFVKILEVLLKLAGLDVELCGRWLWIGGNTRPNKEALKAAGCRWSHNKRTAGAGARGAPVWRKSGKSTVHRRSRRAHTERGISRRKRILSAEMRRFYQGLCPWTPPTFS